MTKGMSCVAVALLAVGCFTTTGTWADAPSPDEGLRVFKSANCMGCHKWSGVGGGGYGGAAASLRQTSLTLDQIEQTITCGRPTTGMPHFAAAAYSDGGCYGLKASDLPPGQMPPEPDHPLRPSEIKSVASYVFTQIKGKGDPTLAQCQAFFGTGTRVCDVYDNQGSASVQPASAAVDPAAAQQHGHLKIETAPDANTGHTESGK